MPAPKPVGKKLFLHQETMEGEFGGEKFTVGNTIPDGSIYIKFPDETYLVSAKECVEEILSLRGKTVVG